VWVSLVYTVTLSVFLLIIGRLSDIFGRRYFMIGGGALGCLGSIICATAKSIPVLVSSMMKAVVADFQEIDGNRSEAMSSWLLLLRLNYPFPMSKLSWFQ